MLDSLRMPRRDHAHSRARRGPLAAVVATILIITACNDATPTPTPAPRQTASAVRVTPTASPTPRPTATPLPTPTPDPITLGKDAVKAAFDGDYTRATVLQQQAIPMLGAPDSDAASRAELAIGKWRLANGDTPGALATFEGLVALPGAPVHTAALVLAGRARAASGDPLGATAHYSQAIAASSVISPWLYLWTGEAYLAANQPANAIEPLTRSLDSAPTRSQEFWRREQLALALQQISDFAGANAQYENILSRSQSGPYRARILWQSAQVLQSAGQTAQAQVRLNEIITQYPKSSSALNALQTLLNAGQSVDEVTRGMIDYDNGLYDAARDAFRRAITLLPKRANEIRYQAALNYIQLGSPADAVRNLDQNIASNPPGTQVVAEALAEKTKLYASLSDTTDAQAAFAQLLTNVPTSTAGVAILFDVAEQLARNNDLVSEAARAYDAAWQQAERSEGQSATQPTETKLQPEALVRLAALEYRLGHMAAVLTTTQTLLTKYADQPQAPLAQLWMGKAQIATSSVTSGTATFQALAQASPDTYEGTRAAELISDATRAPLSFAALRAGASLDMAVDPERTAAEQWLASWSGVTDTVKLRTLRGDIQDDARFARGNELWNLGLAAEAVDEFEALRAALGQDGVAQYQLALHFRAIGLYRQSIGAADTLMRLSPAKTPSKLPAFIAKLIYPTYYADLVLKHAGEFSFDPLLVFALIRQESLFEPFAESFAAANGLMQIVPSTGREINADLGWPPNYTTGDLQKPFVSVRFGTYYLSKQRRFFSGDLYASLAAYNGGAGNAQIWKERSGGDPDLFFMSINFEETQTYIRTISANYAIYHRLYGP